MPKIKAAVAGANGYAGMTAVGLLAGHPHVELVQLTSRSLAGKPYQEGFPLLPLEGRFSEEVEPKGLDVIFSCLPHAAGAARTAEWFRAGTRVIDMSADYRLQDAAQYPRWYGQEHPAPELLAHAVLGLPELHAEEIAQAQLIAVPGCYATAAILALAPAVHAGLVAGDIVVDAKSGVSGAGRSPGLGSHFAEVDEAVSAYALGGHRHLPEITQELAAVAPDREPPRLTFVPHLVPMVRGILATCYFDSSASTDRVAETYREFYTGQPCTRLVPKTPSTKLAAKTNLCLVNVAAQDGKTVVTAALDNLVKGASGQGVECFNIAFGLERTAGLEVAGQWP
ncbi:MAG TPA: N-acetyl-gamma-glutamyl-phosphate reductase [Candidatus Dormibacteraeota bacterium]